MFPNESLETAAGKEKGIWLPLPANVLTFQPQLHVGSAVKPEVVHNEGTVQGIAAAGVPPGQKYPGLHKVAFAKDVDPAIHPNPGAAVQGPEQLKEDKPGEAP